MTGLIPNIAGPAGEDAHAITALNTALVKLADTVKIALTQVNTQINITTRNAGSARELSVASQTLTAISKNLATFGNVTDVVTSIVRNLFQIVTATLQSIVAVISILGSVFNVVKGVFEGVFNLVRGLFNAVTSVVSAATTVVKSASSTVSAVVGQAHSNLSGLLKYSAIVAVGVTAAFVGTAIAAEHAWAPLRNLLARLQISGLGPEALRGLRDYAAQVADATTTASTAVLGLIEKAVRLQVPEKQLKSVTAASVGLADALGISAADALSALVKGLQGNFSALTEYIPALRTAANNTERLRMVTEAAQKGFGMAQQQVTTFAGFWSQLKNTFTANAERLGEKIAPGIAMIVEALRPILPMLESTGDEFAALFNWLAGAISPVISTVVQGLQVLHAGFFSAAQTIAGNWSACWELIVDTVVFSFAFITGHARHALTEVIPAYFNWFVENAKQWVATIGVGLKEGFINLFKNLIDATVFTFNYLRSYLLGGGGGAKDFANRIGFEFSRSITEGFKRGLQDATVSKLPEIASRSIDPIEDSMRDRIKTITTDLGSEFHDRFSTQFDELQNRLGRSADAVKSQIKQLAPIAPAAAGGAGAGGKGNLLESRFLGSAPGGLSPELKTQQQILAEVQAARAERTRQFNERSREFIDKHVQGFAGGKIFVWGL